MRVAIHQPQFLPWLGYLDKIDRADCFVLLDSVQFKKNEWQNRNRIRTADGWQWMTVPVLHDFGQRVLDVRINGTVGWRAKHLKALELHYARAAHREPVIGGLRAIYERSWDRLSDLNVAVIRWLLGEFGIATPLRLSSDMRLPEEPTERLIEICRLTGATSYLAGAGARDYMDFAQFERAGIPVEAQEFRHPIYRQCYEPFVPGLSAIDLLLTCGGQSLHSLRSTRTTG
jgi:hypothetical protein